jgi:hypothetical protein
MQTECAAGKAMNPSDAEYKSPQPYRRQPLSPVTDRPKTSDHDIPAFVVSVANNTTGPSPLWTPTDARSVPAHPAPNGVETIRARLLRLLKDIDGPATTLDMKKRAELPYSTEQISTACRDMARSGMILQLPTRVGLPALYARKGFGGVNVSAEERDVMTSREEADDVATNTEEKNERISPTMCRDGVKADDGKAPYHLLAFDAIGGTVDVLAFGARKYAPRNWEMGIDYSRVYAAAMRHMTAWWMGEDADNETGLSHLDHAACCLMFLQAYTKRGMVERDDRPKMVNR